MKIKIQYISQEERQAALDANADKFLIEEQTIAEGNFLIFDDEKPLIEEIAELKVESALLKTQNQALTEITDFHEELIAEMAMMVYS